jgi:DNA polymerase III delta prime subunit
MIYGNYESQKLLTELLNRDSGVILVVGPEGVGKFSFVKEFLKNLPTENIIVNSEEKILKVETARKIVSLGNKKAEKRYIVINDFHKFLPLVQNTFLKTFEDSQSKTNFVLITSQESKILPTIKSRAIRVKFSLVPEEETRKFLEEKKISEKQIRLALEIFPYQPGKAIDFLNDKLMVQIFEKFYFNNDKNFLLDELQKIWETKNDFDLKKFLEIYLLFLRKQIRKKPTEWFKKNNIIHLKEVLDLYADANYNLNPEFQLTNLFLNNG